MDDMFYPYPSAMLGETVAPLIESVRGITESVPSVSNVVILADSTSIASRAAVNFYCSPHPVSKVCFGASCIFGVAGAASSGAALATSYIGVSITGLLGSLGARTFNNLGRYTLRLGKVASGEITNPADIADLMS